MLVAFAFAVILSGAAFCWGATLLIEAFMTPRSAQERSGASAPRSRPQAPVESLDDVLRRLSANRVVINPVLESRMAEARNPAAFAPTPETIALAKEFQANEARLRAARLRREAWERRRVAARAWIQGARARLRSAHARLTLTLYSFIIYVSRYIA